MNVFQDVLNPLEAQISAYSIFEMAAYWYPTNAKSFPISKYFLFRKHQLYEPEAWSPEFEPESSLDE